MWTSCLLDPRAPYSDGKWEKIAAKTVPIGLITMYRGWAVTLLHNVFETNFLAMMCR